ncbi:MAG: GerAB/ArcD/ProY family transporter [Alicyclobacillaceae bacterium]|nr:GerAB/ArcD/ProY family transporter [Alicyclobacillaceae bacterium]
MSTQIQEKAKVGAKELTALMTMFVATNAFLSYPRYVTRTGLEAAWIEPLLSGAITLLVFLCVDSVIRRRFLGMDILEIAKESFGAPIAGLLAVLFAGWFLANTASVMRQFSENVITTVLPSSPILVIGLLFIAVVWYIAYTGLEGIARASFILMPILLIGTVGLSLATINWWHPLLLLPVWGNGPLQVLVGSFRYSSVFANVLLLSVIYPHAHDPNALRSVGVKSIIWSSLLLSLFIATFHMVFPAGESWKMSFSLYQLARMIDVGRFFQRLESIFVFLWVTSAVIRMALSLWAAAYFLGSAFRWPSFRPALPALAMLAFAASLMPANVNQVVDLDDMYLASWGWVVVFALPLMIVAFARRPKRRVSREWS